MDTALTGNTLPRHPALKAISNGEFLRQLVRALLALTVSAALLIFGYVALAAGNAFQGGSDASARQLPQRIIAGSELSLRYGNGASGPGDHFTLTGLARDGRAIITRNLSLNAGDYPFLETTLTGAHPGESVYFIWKTADNPQKISSAPLHWNGDKSLTYRLANHPEWQGQIIEAGFDIYGDMRAQPLVISGLSFRTDNWQSSLSSIWHDWTVYRGWTQKSINFLRGTPKARTLSPTLAMACWSGLALLLLSGSSFITGRHNIAAYVAAIFIPWMTLDLLWQSNLSTQLEDTKYLFADKTQHEKHLADSDRALYSYAHYLKSEVLPDAGAKRLFLLHDTEKKTYHRLRAQYFLLPHNIYNYDRLPNSKKTRKGDYILVLGDMSGLLYNPQEKALKWGSKSLRVKLVDSHIQGQLYKVLARKK